MAKRSKTTFQKRERERKQQEKQRDKASRRLEATVRKATRLPLTDCEDPDIAGITPGPQPLPEEWNWTPGEKS